MKLYYYGLLRRLAMTQAPVSTPRSISRLEHYNPVMELRTGHCDKLVEIGGTWYCQGFDGNKDVSMVAKAVER